MNFNNLNFLEDFDDECNNSQNDEINSFINENSDDFGVVYINNFNFDTRQDTFLISLRDNNFEMPSDFNNVHTVPPQCNNIINNEENEPLSVINEVQNAHSIINEVKIKIFEIKKVNKKLGRKRKNDSLVNLNNDKIHTKYKDDNIRAKFLRLLCKHILKYLNNSFKSSDNSVIKKQKLLKIDTSVIIFFKKEKNVNLLRTKLKIIFSNELSKRFKNIDKRNNHNRKTIDVILHQNDDNINYILNLTMEDILDIYAGKKEDKIIKNFPTIDNDMAIFKKKREDDIYIERYNFIAKHFKKSIDDIKERNKNNK